MARPCRFARGRTEVANDKPLIRFVACGDQQATARERTSLNQEELATRPHWQGHRNEEGALQRAANLACFTRWAVRARQPAVPPRSRESSDRRQSAHSEKTSRKNYFSALVGECVHAWLRLIQWPATPWVTIAARASWGARSRRLPLPARAWLLGSVPVDTQRTPPLKRCFFGSGRGLRACWAGAPTGSFCSALFGLDLGAGKQKKS
jgi:hypothetical protein